MQDDHRINAFTEALLGVMALAVDVFGSIENRLCGGSGVQPKYLCKLRRIATNGCVAFTNSINLNLRAVQASVLP